MTRRLSLIPILLLVIACGSGGEGVTIKGDVEGLDTLGFRGDSLVALSGRPGAMDSLRLSFAIDSMRASGDSAGAATLAKNGAVAGRLDRARPAAPGDNPMSRRAQARGDSMARAAAQRLVGATNGLSRARGDTMRGVVMVTGQPPVRQPVLRNSAGALIALSGMATAGLARLEGLEVVVRGVKVTPRDVVVSDYIVRTANGVPAWDGRLEQTGKGWSLQLTDGTGKKRVGTLPSALRSMSGSRVWISMHSGGAPLAYGLIIRR